MYNYQKFLKESKEASNLHRVQRIQREEEARREELAKSLIANHDKRIEHSILTLIEHPLRVNNYHDPAYHPRQEDKTKRIAQREMTYNYERQSQRISNAIRRNSSLDLVPFKNPSLYNFRNSRVEEASKGWKAGENRSEMEGRESICSQASQGDGKSWKGRVGRLPSLERLPKTYFHTLETIINKPDTLRITIDQKGNEKVSLSHMNTRVVDSKEFENREERSRIKEDKLRKCKEALERCGVIPQQESRANRHINLR